MSHYKSKVVKRQVAFPNAIYDTDGTAALDPCPVTVDAGNIMIPSGCTGFIQTGKGQFVEKKSRIDKKNAGTAESVFEIPGQLETPQGLENYTCPNCNCYLEKDGRTPIRVQHLPNGSMKIRFNITLQRYRCSDRACGYSVTEKVPFAVPHHRITVPLYAYAEVLLQEGHTLSETADLTGIDRKTVKEIDKKRLQELYTEDGKLKKPETYSEILAVDEFLLHRGREFATVIMDAKNGHVLWLAHGKKKQTVKDFVEHVGNDWISHVKSVACDMNSDYEEAFREANPDIKIVFDRFHIIKNFNDKVIDPVRRDEQERLQKEGLIEEAKHLKRSKYILLASRETLQKHDLEAGTVLRKSNSLFNIPEVVRKGGLEERYNQILSENRLLFTADMIKEALGQAYTTRDPDEMKKLIGHIIAVCFATGNSHFKSFGKLLKNHLHGILTHAECCISSGIMEGTNRKIKTIRWQAYGFADDEYFFLKIFDASRH